jgi:hypothetical protein
MRQLIVAAILLLASAFVAGQANTLCPAGTSAFQNDTTTGTTAFTLTKLTSAGNAIIMSAGDTSGYAGITVMGAGTSGTACLVSSGIWPLRMDGTTTLRHYVQISSATGGDGADTGATTPPTTGGDIIGQVQTASTGAGGFSMIRVFPPEIVAVNPSGAGISGPGSSTVNDIVSWNSTVGAVVQDPGTAQVVNGTVHAANTFYSTTYSTASVSPTTISGMQSPTIAANTFVSFNCAGLWESSSTSGQINLQVNANQTPQQIWYTPTFWMTTTTNKAANSTTNATLVSSGNAGVANNLFAWFLSGAIQWNASAAGTFTIQAASNNTSYTITINPASYCTINP